MLASRTFDQRLMTYLVKIVIAVSKVSIYEKILIQTNYLQTKMNMLYKK